MITVRQPALPNPRRDTEYGRRSTGFIPFRGLYCSSSDSMKSGDKEEPQSRGSGEKENCKTLRINLQGAVKVGLTSEEMVARLDLAPTG